MQKRQEPVAMLRAPAFMTAATLVAVLGFAALGPTTLAAKCSSLANDIPVNTVDGYLQSVVWTSVCAGNYVLSRNDNAICNDGNNPCDVSIINASDHSICCTARLTPFNCADPIEGRPIQILGHRTDDSPTGLLQKSTARTLKIDTGLYSDLFEIPANSTVNNRSDWIMYKLNACGINPRDGHMYCYVLMSMPIRGAQFVARVAKDGVHLVYEITDFDMNNGTEIGSANGEGGTKFKIYSATITPEGDYIVFREGDVASDGTLHAGSYYRVEAVHELPGFVRAGDCAAAASGTAWWLSNEPPDQQWHADIVTLTADLDEKDSPSNDVNGTWVLGIAGAGQSVSGTLYNGTAMLTKISDGPDKGRYYLLDLVFDDEEGVNNTEQQNWGAAWNYYDNLAFADNNGSGVFLGRRIYLDDPTDPNNHGGRIEMSRVGASNPTKFNDGGNCGVPALIPFATCSYKGGPGTGAINDTDCGDGWTATPQTELTRHVVCGFNVLTGIGCTTGNEGDTDQTQCCDRDCSGFCDGHGVGETDRKDVPCTCTCDTGYAGSTASTCDECAPGYVGYPNCTTLSPSVSPTTSDPTISPSTSPTTSDPTMSPSLSPTTSDPTVTPTTSPTTSGPTLSPSASPITSDPTTSPSASPTTSDPTLSPSASPTTSDPTISPSTSPTTSDPTISPSLSPTTSDPTVTPTTSPTTSGPTLSPSASPTTTDPTTSPSTSPTTSDPTLSPSVSPTTSGPTMNPTRAPLAAFIAPTRAPVTSKPTSSPSLLSVSPTTSPTTSNPTVSPSASPTTSDPTTSPSTSPATSDPTPNPAVSPTVSCPVHFAARADRRSGAVGDIHSVHTEQACADLCWQRRPYAPGVDMGHQVNLGYGCVAFTTSPGVATALGYIPTNCALVIGDAQSDDDAVPCEEGSRCCSLILRTSYCPAGYGDYGTRFNQGLGRITVVQNHQQCADRCTQYAGAQYMGGCKAYMTGMYFGMVFCRSYGGNLRTMTCAPWAVPWHKGAFSGELGTVNYRTGQMNVGGNCCTRMVRTDDGYY